MNKKIITTLVIVFVFAIITTAFLSIEEKPTENNENEIDTSLIECLDDNDLVIYGASTCPACKQLVASLGGQETVESIYVECGASGSEDDQQKCQQNAETGYVPEIQIDGQVYEGPRDPASLAGQVGCEL